jgi:hypothetical protein
VDEDLTQTMPPASRRGDGRSRSISYSSVLFAGTVESAALTSLTFSFGLSLTVLFKTSKPQRGGRERIPFLLIHLALWLFYFLLYSALFTEILQRWISAHLWRVS